MESIRSKEEGQEDQTTLSEWSEMALPGFRFHPTEEELVGYYLRRMVQGRRNSVELIASLDLYQYDPWELPAMAFMGEKEWFFFCPRDKKYPNGARPNRVTASGYWKATGTDRPVRCSGDFRCIGLKKTLVFYTGRAPRGNKTEWIMNEYRMPKPAERSISVMTSGVNSINYSFSTYDNFVIKNDVALCRIYRKSSSALNSVSFISAIGGRDIEDRTTRMVSRFETNYPAAAAAAHLQQQQHHQIQQLQEQAPPPNTLNVRVSSSEMTMPSLPAPPCSGNGDTHAQQSMTKTTATSVTRNHVHVIEAGTQRHQQQHQHDGDAPAQGRFDHGIVPTIIDCATTSEEASRQLQIALRTAMAKLDGVGGSATANFKYGESIGSNGSGIFGRFRSRLVEDTSATAACTSTRAMRSPSPEAAACAAATSAMNHNYSYCSRIYPSTAYDHYEHFNHPLSPSCSRDDVPRATPLLRTSLTSDAVTAVTVAAFKFTPIKNDPSCCGTSRISIPPSFSQQHLKSCPLTTTTTTQCLEGARASPSVIALNDINVNNNNATTTNTSSHISTSSITHVEEEVQNLVSSCILPPLTNTYSLKPSRFSRVQQPVGETCPVLAKIPSVAQYWRQSSSALNSAAAGAPAVATQLSTFDA